MSEQLEQYLTGLGLKLSAREGYNPHADDKWAGMRHYRVTLTGNGKRMSFWFYQGAGITEPPSLGSVVECLAQDRTYATQTVEDFADELGYEWREARAIHKQLVSLNTRYEKVVGSESLCDEIYERVCA